MDSSHNSAMTEVLGLGPEHSRKVRRWRLLIAIVIFVMAVSGIAAWISGSSRKDAVNYITADVIRGNLDISVTATGTLEPVNQVVVGSELSGTVSAVLVDFNSQVRKGQTLARLDTTTLKAQVIQAEASQKSAEAGLRQAEVNLKESENSYSRVKRAWQTSSGAAVSENDLASAEATFERAKAALSTTEAQVAEAVARLEVSRDNLSKAAIVSPIDGVVLNRTVEPGQTVAASLQAPVLFTIAEDIAHMELHVFVDEADVGQIRKGQHAVFTVDAYPDRKFDALITELRYTPTETEGVVTYETILTVDNSDLALRPGMTATAEISTMKVDGALMIPNSALRFSPPKEQDAQEGGLLSRLFPQRRHGSPQGNGGNKHDGSSARIWVLTGKAESPIEPKLVKTGPTDGSRTAIINGPLDAGMKVVTGVQAKAK